MKYCEEQSLCLNGVQVRKYKGIQSSTVFWLSLYRNKIRFDQSKIRKSLLGYPKRLRLLKRPETHYLNQLLRLFKTTFISVGELWFEDCGSEYGNKQREILHHESNKTGIAPPPLNLSISFTIKLLIAKKIEKRKVFSPKRNLRSYYTYSLGCIEQYIGDVTTSVFV